MRTRSDTRHSASQELCSGKQAVSQRSLTSLLFVKGSSECTGEACHGALVSRDVLQVTAPDNYLGLASKVLRA